MLPDFKLPATKPEPGFRPKFEPKREPTSHVTAAERPSRIVMTTTEIGGFVCQLRRDLKIRQADLARRAHVGRQWIVALEQGKPSVELALALRTLETLGLEVKLTPYDPVPAWITRAIADTKKARETTRLRRTLRRRNRREVERLNRLGANAPKVVVDLE